MSVRLDGATIRLEGRCRIGEAETLLALLLEDDARAVDLSGCGALHCAVVQVLVALRPVVDGTPADPFIGAHILPLLQGGGPSSGSINN